MSNPSDPGTTAKAHNARPTQHLPAHPTPAADHSTPSDPVLPPIVHASWAEIDATTNLIADAYFHLRPAKWLVPDPTHRALVLRDQFRILVEHALFYGHIDLYDDRSAAAVWFHHTSPVPPPHNYDHRLQAVCGDYVNRFRCLNALYDARQPGEAHHRLALLAVTPHARNTARASALLTHHHRQLDRDRIPAFLFAHSPRSRDLYQHHGYTTRRRLDLPDTTPIWPMWRHPATTPPQPAADKPTHLPQTTAHSQR